MNISIPNQSFSLGHTEESVNNDWGTLEDFSVTTIITAVVDIANVYPYIEN